MPYPIGARYPDPGNSSREQSELKRSDAQLQRLMANRPKIPAPSTGGGIEGQAEFFANTGTVGVAAGETNALFTDITYGAPYDPTGGPAPDWVSFDSSEPYRIFLEPGWYGAVMYLQLSWGVEANAPQGFGPYMGGGDDNAHQGYATFARARLSSSTWGIQQYVNYGHVKASTGIDFHAECRFTPTPGAAATTALCSVGWTFTKYA